MPPLGVPFPRKVEFLTGGESFPGDLESVSSLAGVILGKMWSNTDLEEVSL